MRRKRPYWDPGFSVVREQWLGLPCSGLPQRIATERLGFAGSGAAVFVDGFDDPAKQLTGVGEGVSALFFHS